MSECLVIKSPSAELWTSFLNMFPEGNFEQCFEYGEISKISFPSTKVVKLAITVNGNFAGIVQGTYSSYFGFGMNLRIMRGPIVDTKHKERLRLVKNLLIALEEYGKRKRIIHAQILVPEIWQLDKAFLKLGYSRAGKLNEYSVNLEKGIDELWRHIAHNKRRNIKKAMKKGVEVVQSHNYEDVLTFYSLLESSKKRGGFSTYPLSWFKAIWKLYKPGRLSKIFLTQWRGKSVSGVFVVIHGKTVYALAAGSFREGWKVRPNDIMHWKVMEWACRNDYSKYHMGLVSEPPPTVARAGIWRWKKEWNGKLERIQLFDKLFLPRYKLILKAKKFIEHYYTRFR